MSDIFFGVRGVSHSQIEKFRALAKLNPPQDDASFEEFSAYLELFNSSVEMNRLDRFKDFFCREKKQKVLLEMRSLALGNVSAFFSLRNQANNTSKSHFRVYHDFCNKENKQTMYGLLTPVDDPLRLTENEKKKYRQQKVDDYCKHHNMDPIVLKKEQNKPTSFDQAMMSRFML